jgi:DNA polymerase III delta prime subunit
VFENILYQQRTIEILSNDVRSSALAPAILFHGPEYAGKLSTALELARVVSCLKPGAPWGCECTMCQQHRFIMSPYTLFLGRRAFGREIRAAAKAVFAEDKDATRFLFLRAVRKLLRRFDQVLWEQDTKLSQAAKIVEKLDEHLDLLAPGKPALEKDKAEAACAEIFKLTDSLAALLPQDGVSIAMIRRVSYWVRTADAAHPKIVFIEGAESMNESCRNSLLKILEEPPPSVYFILLTTHKNAVMQTVLSRVRAYAFAERSSAIQAEVVERLFRQPKGSWSGFRTFFGGGEDKSGNPVRGRAEDFGNALLWKTGLSCLVEPAEKEPADPAGPVSPGRRSSGSPKPMPAHLGLSALTEGLGRDRDDLEDLIRLSSRALLDRLNTLGSQAELLQKAGLDEIRAADSIQALVRRLSRAYSEALIYNLSGSELIERVYSEAEDGPCVVSFKGQ